MQMKLGLLADPYTTMELPARMRGGRDASLPRRERGDHVEFDAGARRGELVDADGRAGRRPVAEILLEHRDHAILVADVGHVFRDLHDVGEGEALVFKNALDRFEAAPGLVLDAVRVVV